MLFEAVADKLAVLVQDRSGAGTAVEAVLVAETWSVSVPLFCPYRDEFVGGAQDVEDWFVKAVSYVEVDPRPCRMYCATGSVPLEDVEADLDDDEEMIGEDVRLELKLNVEGVKYSERLEDGAEDDEVTEIKGVCIDMLVVLA